MSSRDEFPADWILSPGGNPEIDTDYTFVICGVYYKDPESEEQYHVGVTALGELVGSWSPGGPGSLIYTEARALTSAEIPKPALNKLAEEGLLQIGSMQGNLVLSALGVELPTEPGPINYSILFNGTDAEKTDEQEKVKRWNQIAEELRQELIV